jgi:acetate kinase
MPTRASISKRGKGPIRAEAEPDVTANHAPIQISRGAGVTLVVASLLGLAFVGWKAPSVLTTVGGFALALAFSFPRSPLISGDDTAVTVRVVPTDEDLVVARHTRRLIEQEH